MIDPNEILQSFGVWGLFIVAVAGFIWMMGRGVYARLASQSNESNAMVTMALDATQRANTLADVRFAQVQKISELEKRLAAIEPIVKRVPKLEDDYAKAIADLESVTRELKEALKREETKDQLIHQLEEKIRQLEEKVKQYETTTHYDDGDTRPLLLSGDITGGRTDDRPDGGTVSGGSGGGDGN